MGSRLPELMPLHSPGSFALTQNTPYIFDLYRQAAEVHSYFNTVCERIARETKATWYPAPLKKLFRMLEKAEHVQGNGRQQDSMFFDCSRIFDIVRGTLVYDTLGDQPGGVLCGIHALFKCGKFQ